MYTWLRDEGFKERLKAAKRSLWEHSMRRLQGTTSEAVENLRSVMSDSDAPASAKVTAARTVLEFAKNNIELADLEERLKALETERNTSDEA